MMVEEITVLDYLQPVEGLTDEDTYTYQAVFPVNGKITGLTISVDLSSESFGEPILAVKGEDDIYIVVLEPGTNNPKVVKDLADFTDELGSLGSIDSVLFLFSEAVSDKSLISLKEALNICCKSNS